MFLLSLSKGIALGTSTTSVPFSLSLANNTFDNFNMVTAVGGSFSSQGVVAGASTTALSPVNLAIFIFAIVFIALYSFVKNTAHEIT